MLAPEDDLELLNNEGEVADESKFSSFFLGPVYNTIKEILWATGTVIICLCVAALVFTYTERKWQVMNNEVEEGEYDDAFIDIEAVRDMRRMYNSINTTLTSANEIDDFRRLAEAMCGQKREVYDYQWHFGGALDYVISVLTTVGWGNIVPVTAGGKFITALYILGGIPVMMLFLYSLTDLMDSNIIALRSCFVKRIERIESNPDGWALYSITGIIVSLTTFMILVMAGVSVKRTQKWDISGADLVPGWAGDGKMEWEFWDAFYFQVISLLTVGFGDFHHKAYDISFGSNQFFFVFIPICLFLTVSKTLFNQFKEKRCVQKVNNAQQD